MRKVILLYFLVLSTIVFAKGEVRNMVTDSLINALIRVESNGDSTKVGKLGELGILQIRQCVIDDVNRIYKTKYILEDAKNNEKAKDICRKYLTHWGRHYEIKTGLKADNKVLSKIWNGGPKGPWKETTYIIAYWNKVQKQLC